MSDSPGFVGERLKEARQARELTQTALAEMVEVTRAAVAQYEGGIHSPRPDVVSRLAAVLNVPEHLFFRALGSPAPAKIFYRSQASATKRARSRAEIRRSWAAEIVQIIEEYVDLPPVDLPPFHVSPEPNDLEGEDIERLAEDTRDHWDLGHAPIENLVGVLERAGILVLRHQLASRTLDGLSWVPTRGLRPWVVLGSDKMSAVRSRLDAAHELGHIVLHWMVPEKLLSTSAVHKVMEDQAYRFGAAFLLPCERFSADFVGPTLNNFLFLKRKWKVSVGMMIMRARHLKLISKDEEGRLWRAYNRRGWRRDEPYDGEMAVERPRVLTAALQLVFDERVLSPATLVELAPVNPAEIEGLLCLPEGMIRSQLPDLHAGVRRRQPAEQVAAGSERGGPAKVIRFPADSGASRGD